jgi:hypothetical protein
MAGRSKDGPVAVLVPRSASKASGLLVGVAVLAAFLVGAGKLGGLLPSLPNPFGSRTVDRTQPALLKSLEDLSRYEAASANFQVIVDSEKDARFLPAVIKGERTVYVAGGSVKATVDFSALDERSIQASPDHRSVAISLPEPALAEAQVDPKQSRVVSRDRGLLDRVGSVFSDSPTSERNLTLAAQQKMQAAASESDLRNRAEQNTRRMLEGVMRSLGYTSVTVTFAANPT